MMAPLKGNLVGRFYKEGQQDDMKRGLKPSLEAIARSVRIGMKSAFFIKNGSFFEDLES